MLGAQRAAQQGHIGRSCRRSGEINVEPFVQERLPHRRTALQIWHDNGNDRRLWLLGSESEAERLEAGVKLLAVFPEVIALGLALHPLADRVRKSVVEGK